MLRSASALPPRGNASFTNPLGGADGAGPMLNTVGFELPPPRLGWKTATEARPTAAISEAKICAVRCWLSTKLVDRSRPFQRTRIPAAKLDRVAVIVRAGSPALACFGEMDASTGPTEALERGTAISQTLRPCVAARRTRAVLCSFSDWTTTRGSWLPRIFHDAPVSVLNITPASVATYSLFGISGS